MYWLLIVALIVLLYLLYGPISELVFHIWHLGTLYRGNTDKRVIALTFDDGPDPRYTPQVMQILEEHGVHATFFLVGQRAEQHPELVQALVDHGHEIASHSYLHKHAWLRDPISTVRDIAKSKRVLERLSGQPIRFHRPPWGAFNPFTRLACTRLGLVPTLWSVRAVDWEAGEYADAIVTRVVTPAEPGSIVLCHDAGGAPGAPLNTIQALPKLIPLLKQLGFSFATVGEMHEAVRAKHIASPDAHAGYPLWRRSMIRIWSIVEMVFTRMYDVLTINEIFRVGPSTWRHGERRDADTGVIVVENGAKALDIHFQNQTVLQISQGGDNRSLVRGLRMTKSGFEDIARVLQFHPDYKDVQVAMAVTLMNRGIEMLGFHVEDLPNSIEKRRLQAYMRFLTGMYHPEGFRRLRQGSQSLTLKLIWMTRDEIIRLYGNRS